MPGARHILTALLLVSLVACSADGDQHQGGAAPSPTPPTSNPAPTPSPLPDPVPPSPPPVASPTPTPVPTPTPPAPAPTPTPPAPTPNPAPTPTPAPPRTDLLNSVVAVPGSMKAAPFDVERRLNIPSGFSVAVFARVPGARFLLTLPNGDLLVSQPGAGKITLLRPRAGQDPQVSTFVAGLASPHDMVLAGGYLYVSEKNRVSRAAYTDGATTAGPLQPLVVGLPDSSLSELKGAYGHELKNFAVSGDQLFVSIASATNEDPADQTATPKRGAIYVFRASASNQAATSGRLFAQGIRNAEGLAFAPGTSDLWVVVNNRDNIPYPDHKDFDGDGSDDYGRVLPGYVDNHPPEEFIKVQSGANYGWPYCNPNPDAGMSDMPYVADTARNPNDSKLDCSTLTKVTRGLQAHAAPLGLTFWAGDQVPAAFRGGAVVGLHGSWNRTSFSGHKFVFFPLSGGALGAEQDLVTGFVTNAAAKQRWGRPVDAAVAPDGGLYLSDDQAGAVYTLTPKP